MDAFHTRTYQGTLVLFVSYLYKSLTSPPLHLGCHHSIVVVYLAFITLICQRTCLCYLKKSIWKGQVQPGLLPTRTSPCYQLGLSYRLRPPVIEKQLGPCAVFKSLGPSNHLVSKPVTNLHIRILCSTYINLA